MARSNPHFLKQGNPLVAIGGVADLVNRPLAVSCRSQLRTAASPSTTRMRAIPARQLPGRGGNSVVSRRLLMNGSLGKSDPKATPPESGPASVLAQV